MSTCFFGATVYQSTLSPWYKKNSLPFTFNSPHKFFAGIFPVVSKHRKKICCIIIVLNDVIVGQIKFIDNRKVILKLTEGSLVQEAFRSFLPEYRISQVSNELCSLSLLILVILHCFSQCAESFLELQCTCSFIRNVTVSLFFVPRRLSCGDLIDRDLAKLNNPVTVLSAITKTFPFVVLRVELYGYKERVLFVQLTITSTFSRAHLFWQNFTATCWKRDILEG